MGFGLIGLEVMRGSVYLYMWLLFYLLYPGCNTSSPLRPTRPLLGYELLDQEFLWNAVKVPK